MHHLIANDLLTREQHGFVPGKASVTNLFETTNFLTNSIRNKVAVDIIFVDFAEAFDKFPHQKLLGKLRNKRQVTRLDSGIFKKLLAAYGF